MSYLSLPPFEVFRVIGGLCESGCVLQTFFTVGFAGLIMEVGTTACTIEAVILPACAVCQNHGICVFALSFAVFQCCCLCVCHCYTPSPLSAAEGLTYPFVGHRRSSDLGRTCGWTGTA